MWKKVGQDASPANHPPAAKHWWLDAGLPRAAWLHRRGLLPFVLQCKRSSSRRYFHSKNYLEGSRSNPDQYRAGRVSAERRGKPYYLLYTRVRRTGPER